MEGPVRAGGGGPIAVGAVVFWLVAFLLMGLLVSRCGSTRCVRYAFIPYFQEEKCVAKEGEAPVCEKQVKYESRCVEWEER
jgi:hypothetical protein